MRVLQIEFNELSPQLLTDFMSAGQLPHFRRFYQQSQVFTTDARTEPPNLEPWVQWPTVHFGVSHLQHGLLHLNQPTVDDDARPSRERYVPIAEALSAAGVRVGVFGSMNVPYEELDGFYVPDPWNTVGTARPGYLAPYLRTVGAMVRDSSRTDGVTEGAGLLPFGVFLARHGLTLATVRALVGQLVAERRDRGVRWRRASVLDWIQYDVFRDLVRREKVEFATFFSNSTAHYQHYFWRHMTPAQFDSPPDAADHPSYGEAVLSGYRSMDRILGRMMADYPDATLVLSTALSQQPWTDATKQTYRPKSWDAALGLIGLTSDQVDVQPIMAEQFVLRFPTEERAVLAQEAFDGLTMGGQPLMRFSREGDALIGGCAIDHAGATSGRIIGAVGGGEPLLGDVFTAIHTVRSGRHSSEGALWFRTGEHVVHDEPVDLESIAPTVMRLLGVTPPDHMQGAVLPIGGTSPAGRPR